SPIIHQPLQELSIQEMKDLKQQYLDELKRLSNLEYRDEIKIAELKENFNGMSIEIRKKEKLQQLEQWAYLCTHPSKRFNSFCYDDDEEEDYTIAVTPNEVIKSSVENLIPIPSEFEGIPDHMCDVPSHDNSSPLDISKDQFEDLFDSNEEFSSNDEDSFSIDNIDYVEASPSDSELVSSEVMEIVIPEVGLTIKNDILWEKLLNVNLLIAKIEALNANPTPSFDCKTKSPSTSLNSLLEETNTFDNSLPEDFTKDVVEDISPAKEPQFHNALPTHPTLQLNMKFQPSSEYLFTYVVWIFFSFLVYSVAPYYFLSLGNEDTIFDPGICNSNLSRPDISHRCGTFPRFKVLPESPMEIFSSTCSPMDQ
nr:hypothetical protein [Tanacetum cinerariifolium]